MYLGKILPSEMALFYRYTEENWVGRNRSSLFKTERGWIGQVSDAESSSMVIVCFAESPGAYSCIFLFFLVILSFLGRCLEARPVLLSIQGLIFIAGDR